MNKRILHRQAGFTLVEMAMVLMIIGLLIAGILRGQELMENARVTAAVQQVKSYDGAVTTFRDIYRALPGDLAQPASRLANCTANPCNLSGNGDGVIGESAIITSLSNGQYSAAPSAENRIFWLHLAVVHLISGVNPSSSATALSWSRELPLAGIGGGFHVAFANIPPQPGMPGVNGHYLVLHASPNSGQLNEGDGMSAIPPLRAAQIDRKLDDGLAQAGDVLGIGNTNCTGTGTPLRYGETSEQRDCNMMIRVQN